MTAEDDIIARATRLIEMGERLYGEGQPPPPNVESVVDAHDFAVWRSRSTAFLRSLVGVAPGAEVYAQSFEARINADYASDVLEGVGYLRGAKEDVVDGHLVGTRRLLRAEVFAEFLEMAEYLLSEGYYVPAASLAGAVLEESLRGLVSKNDLKSTGNLQSLNDVCAQNKLYDRNWQMQVKVWIDIRNAADHGDVEKLDEARVASMVRDLPGFLTKH